VNWCPALGSVLANDEVKDGVSERGNHPVERKLMKQWMMRITAYADRMLKNLDDLDWSDALKEIQRNWIGKSLGCEVNFRLADCAFPEFLTVFTTRPDTIFGVSFVTIAPEHEWVSSLTSEEQQAETEKYVAWAKNRSERERMENVKSVSGVFTGSYVLHPFTGARIPVWVSEYVLAGYGTGVVMGVPASDERDFRFAKHFNLPILPVIDKTILEDGAVKEAYSEKIGKMINSDFLNGLEIKEAVKIVTEKIEKLGFGKAKVNFKIRDAVFGRQRYWGEPIPIWYDENNVPNPLSESELPLILPEIDEYKPTAEGEPPLGRAKNWKYKGQYQYELTTMPGWAGSSWYFLRYADNKNSAELVGKEAADFWGQVDLYVGGSEHATGHLLYARFWNMFLFDCGIVSHEEPFKKLVNQGMIQGRSALVYQIKGENKFVSVGLKDNYETVEIHCDVNIVENDVLDIEKFKKWRSEYENASFVLENGKFICGSAVEKMSKRWYNVVNPSDVIERYGADTLRLFEMFLGPLEMSKPWNTSSIDGVSRFLRKLWRLFYDEKGNFIVSEERADKSELKILHKTIKKTEDDLERMSLNTVVSALMICVNELTEKKCSKREILTDLLILLSPYAPHIAEELYEKLGQENSIFEATFPKIIAEYLLDDTVEYAVQINGKLRATCQFPADAPKEDIEKTVLALETVQKWLEGNAPKKIIIVPKKLVNVVI
jgi:leucyl-tRNA synthetase